MALGSFVAWALCNYMTIDILVLEDLDNLPKVTEKTAVRLPDGREGYLYPSGVIKNSRGHFMLGAELNGGALRFNSATASQAVSMRERIKDSAVEEAIKEHGNGDLQLGIQKLINVQVQIASKEKNRRDSTAALMELLKIGGFIKSKYTGTEQKPSEGPAQLDSEEISILKAITNRYKQLQSVGEITPDKVQKQELSDAAQLIDLDPDLSGGAGG